MIDILAVTDAQLPEGESSSRTNGQRAGIRKDDDLRLTTGRVIAGVSLLLASVGVILWIFLARPDSLAGTVSLVVLVALLLGGISAVLVKVLPPKVRGPLVALVGVAVVSATLIATFLTIPSKDSVAAPGTSRSETLAAAPSPSPSPSESDPLTATLKFKIGEGCEGFILEKSVLPSIPRDDLRAEWVYKHGGTTGSSPVKVIVQGKTDDAVVLEGIRIINFERRPATSEYASVAPCEPMGGGTDTRWFDITLNDRPKIRPKNVFPLQVSNSDPEVFIMKFYGPPGIYSFRVALDWTSLGKSGTIKLDHGFDKIKLNLSDAVMPEYYRGEDGSWVPPLPR
jgi:hypothetical protein